MKSKFGRAIGLPFWLMKKWFRKCKYEYWLDDLYKEWRKKNSHNDVYLKAPFPDNSLIDIVSVGNLSSGIVNVNYYKTGDEHLSIGNLCSIATDSKFILGGEHHQNCLSTIIEASPGFSKGHIVVDDDVWIGSGSTIMSGVHIGQGCIVAAGSLVTKDTPPYTIVGGVPAKVIGRRFAESIANKLLSINLNKITKDNFKDYKELLKIPLNEKNVDEIVSKINEL